MAQGVPRLVLASWLVEPGPGVCLQGPWCPNASACLLMGGLHHDMAGCGVLVVLGLVSACWWAELWSRGSWGWVLTIGG